MSELLAILASELERSRPLLPQVIKHLSGTHGVERQAVGSFLIETLPSLEDWEIDLILSPLFTPKLADQSRVASQLGARAVPASEWPALVQQIVQRPVCARIATEDGQTHVVPLREVTVERYVRRLQLDATIPAPLLDLINHLAPAADRPMLLAIARRAIWNRESRREMLQRILTHAITRNQYRLDDAVALLKLAETYEPSDAEELRARIPHWEEVLRHQIGQGSNPKPFFNERVQELHGGGRDQRRPDDVRQREREEELAFLQRLKTLLSS